jgi:hypothetical protein
MSAHRTRSFWLVDHGGETINVLHQPSNNQGMLICGISMYATRQCIMLHVIEVFHVILDVRSSWESFGSTLWRDADH